MKTYAVAELDFIDVEALEDGSITAVGNRSFADTAVFKEEETAKPSRYGTLERNAFILDGTIGHFPDDPEGTGYGYYSTSASTAACAFYNHPKITVEFSELHSSVGLTLYFADFYPAKLQVRWYGSLGLIAQQEYYPDSLEYFCEGHVEDYNKVEIEVLQTSYPQEFVKLYGIKYGTNFMWTEGDIVSASINEEVDPVSSELSINTATLTIHNQDKAFNLANPEGIYAFIQPKQRIQIMEYKNFAKVDMGTFYVDTWESSSETQITFNCIDGIGILDKTDFKAGKVYEDEPAKDIIDDIMQSAGWADYEVSEEITDTLSGYLPVCTHREALQQVAFAIGAVVDDSRGSTIRIYLHRRSVTTTIGKDRKFMGNSTLRLREYVSDVCVTTHKYVKGSELEELFNGYLYAGTNEILFDNPCEVVSVAGCTLVSFGTNYAIVTVVTPGDCIISGYVYEDKQSSYTRGVESLPAGHIRNTVTVDSATFANPKNAPMIAKRLLDYYSLRQVNEIKYLVDYERSGRWTGVVSQFGEYFAGCLEKQTIDLSGGFIGQATIVGYNKQLLALYYAGELYARDSLGVL